MWQIGAQTEALKQQNQSVTEKITCERAVDNIKSPNSDSDSNVNFVGEEKVIKQQSKRLMEKIQENLAVVWWMNET